MTTRRDYRNDPDKGLYLKYRAFKAGGPHDPLPSVPIRVGGVAVVEVEESFFLLKFRDAYAWPALEAYADACEGEFPQLASDIRDRVLEWKLQAQRDSMMTPNQIREIS